MTADQCLVLALLTLPLIAAVVVASLGPNRAALVRWISLGVSVLELVLALTLAGRFLALEHTTDLHALPTFTPEFVPGSTASQPHRTHWDWFQLGTGGAIQF